MFLFHNSFQKYNSFGTIQDKIFSELNFMENWSVGVLECWSIGVLKFWSDGVLDIPLNMLSFISISLLFHYSRILRLFYVND